MRACKSAEKSINRIRPSEAIRLKCNASQILSGEDVFTEVLSKIDGSDICVFNLSEKNANVIFELGYAHGRNKQTIWISNENLPLAEMPADFQEKFVVRYEGSTELEMLLEGKISKRLQSIVTIEENRDSFSEILQLASNQFVDLIFGALPAEDRSKYGRHTEKNYVRYQNFADVDTFVYLSRFLSRNFPNLDPRDYVPDEYAKDVDAPTFLVGGPFWNRAARPEFAVCRQRPGKAT